MDEAEEGIKVGNVTQLIANIDDITEPNDIRSLVSTAVEMDDDDALWYIIEKRWQYDDNLGTYLIQECGNNGRRFPCLVLQDVGNPLQVLRRGVENGNQDLVLYAVDILYSPINPQAFESYSTQDFNRALQISRNNEEQGRDIILEATPSFLQKIFPFLPKRLQANLLLSY